MSAAGRYPVCFAWCVHTYGSPSAVGDPTDVYADPVNLWGGYDADRTGTIQQVLNADEQVTTATVRFRNYPAVGPLDSLTDPQSGEVWYVDTVRRGANEILCDVSR